MVQVLLDWVQILAIAHTILHQSTCRNSKFTAHEDEENIPQCTKQSRLGKKDQPAISQYGSELEINITSQKIYCGD